MKTKQIVKASLFTLILAFFAIGTIAYAKAVMKKENVKDVETTLVFQTWRFTGAVDNDPTNPLNYTLEQPSDPSCSLPYEKICSISAPDDGTGHPKMDEEVYDPATSSDQTIEDLIERANNSLATSPQLNVAVTAFRAN